MDNQRVLLEPAFVVHARPFRDTSAIVDYLTADHGRLTLVARSVRGERPRWRLAAQSFQPLMMSWQRRGEMGSLVAVEPASAPLHLTGNWLYSGFYINELVVRLTHRDIACPGLFESYRTAITALASEVSIEPVLRRFEKALLDELGCAVFTDHTADSHVPIRQDEDYWYQPEVGATEMMRPGAIKIEGRLLRVLANGHWDEATDWLGIKRVHRAVLSYYLGSKPLRSRELFAVTVE